MKRILSGIKPTGKPHIGNYFGMMRPAIEWQDKGEAFYFIADYHALTTVFDPVKLREYSRGVALDFLSCGLDPAKAVLFRQSDVPAHTELAWLLSCQTPMPMLENAHAYKDHVAREKTPLARALRFSGAHGGGYLIYDSDIVPVGKDQKQHVEITRDIAVRMNTLYGPIFKIPEPSILPTVATIPGLDGQKMSKSYDNTIELFLEEKALKKKIMGIVTDSTPVEAPKDPRFLLHRGSLPVFRARNGRGKDGNGFPGGWRGLRRFQKAAFRGDLGIFSCHAGEAGRTGGRYRVCGCGAQGGRGAGVIDRQSSNGAGSQGSGPARLSQS
ncbi:MAG: tryptophan--tRNA ligase [Chthoniobacter sp.]